jgi:glycine C-acetyltransferase/8-amino-7-oxononanoate synthase
VIEIEARMSELDGLGLRRRTRLVSGPQGPRVVLDGKPTLVLCSSNYLGLADHPSVREAAGDAAMRWGAGATATRLGSGTMTIHRRLEERLAAFLGRQAALLFGSGYLAGVGVIAALARPGDVVFCDEESSGSIVDGCRLSGAEVFVYDHLDMDHLHWGIAKAEGRGALIVTHSVFPLDGDVAPLPELIQLAERRRLRLMVDEGHGIGMLGDGGRGALAQFGLEDQVDVIVGTLGHTLGSYGGFVACHHEMADYLLNASRTLQFSSAPSPPAAAAALAALTMLEGRPQLVSKLTANAAVLRNELEKHGFYFDPIPTAILSIPLGDAALANRVCDATLRRRVLAEAVCPPIVAEIKSRLRLTVMASHRREELTDAAGVVADACLAAGFEPGVLDEYLDEDESAVIDPQATQLFDVYEPTPGIFDVERLAA